MARFSGVSAGTVPASVNSLVATTLPKLQKSVVDNFFNATPLLMWLKEKGRTKPWNGGDTMEVPLLIQDNPMGGAYLAWQPMDIRPPRGVTTAIYSLAHYRIPIAYSRIMAAANRGESQVVNLIQTLKDQAELSLRKVINTDLWGTTANAVKINALPVMLEELASPTQTAVVGGISKSAYASWWFHPYKSIASTATGIMSAIRQLYMQAGDGSDFPDLFVCDDYTYTNLEDKLQTAVRFVNPDAIDWGFENVVYKGMTIMYDKSINDDGANSDGDGTGYMLNTKYVNLYIGTDANFRVVPTEYDLKQDAFVGAILVDLQLCISQMRKQAVLQGGAYAAAC